MKAINDLKIEDSSLRMQLESGEERLSSLKRLVEAEKLKLRDDDADLAVAEARTAEVSMPLTFTTIAFKKISFSVVFTKSCFTLKLLDVKSSLKQHHSLRVALQTLHDFDDI